LIGPSSTIRRKERPSCVIASLAPFGDVRALCIGEKLMARHPLTEFVEGHVSATDIDHQTF
jgi:hypothetical protein